jgi:hypothetical protein
MNRLRMLAAALAVLTLGTSLATCQTWQPLTNQPSFSPGAVLLLTDGTVLAHSEPNFLNCTSTDYNSCYKLTPDSSSSYVNGTWTQVASPTGYAPLYFGSVVLPDGHVVVECGEYDCSSGTCNAAWTNQGAIYDPVKNVWTSVAPPTVGKPSAMRTLTWTPTGTGKFDIHDEEGWTLLPTGKILTVKAYVFQYDATGTNSELYNPATGSWASAGSTIQQLWDCGSTAASYEVGPAALQP